MHEMESGKQPRAILLLPFIVTVVVPATILLIASFDTFDLWQSSPVTRGSEPNGCPSVTLRVRFPGLAPISLIELFRATPGNR